MPPLREEFTKDALLEQLKPFETVHDLLERAYVEPLLSGESPFKA